MASKNINVLKRFIKPTVNYLEIGERVPPNQEKYWIQFTKRHEQYLIEFYKYPYAILPKIDWEFYRNSVAPRNITLVDNMKSSYESYTIPYPKDELTPLIEQQIKDVQREIQQFIIESKQRINEYKCEKIKLENMIPFDEMTIEEYCLLFPDDCPNYIERPTFWPHEPEDQIINNTTTNMDVLQE